MEYTIRFAEEKDIELILSFIRALAEYEKLSDQVSEHVICAGGLLDEEGKMKGSVLIMAFDTRKELDDYLAGEPYVTEHVWEEVDVERMNVVIVRQG